MLDDAQLQTLRDSFKAEVLDLLTELEAALMDMEANPDDTDLTNRAFRALHSVKGSGTMFGFEEMSDFVHEIETVFDRVRKGEIAVTRRLIDLTLSAKDELMAMLNRESPDTTPRRDTTEPILNGYRELLAGGESSDEGGRSRGDRADDAAGSDNGASDPRSALPATYRIEFHPPVDLLQTGTDPLMLIDELRELGTCTVVANTDRVPNLEAVVPDECYLSWEVELTTSSGREAIAEVFEFVAAEAELTIERLDDDAGTLAAQPRASGTPAREEDGGRGVGSGAAASATPAQSPAARSDGTIRVPSDRLDSLVDLIGELVTVQARLSGHVVEHGDATFVTIAETIERLTDELRDNAMSLRMVPIRGTFSRFRRLVRDLAGQLGKEVQLETTGEETELDKTVIERLGDPLMHVIRNSIDHGIEAPDERERNGKERAGTIRLRAAHEGASVVVSVSDDGRGLDLDRIRETAIERGVIAADAELTDAETRNLIFAPGFSTAASVTELSGRGVGMDVVRRTVDALRGSIETTSEWGRGTTVSLRLPLTLAIIDGLLVRVSDQHYVLPLGSVQELLEFNESTTDDRAGVRLMDYRGSRLAYVDLHGLFESGDEDPDDSQVVVVDWDGDRVGLVVSEVIGQQQTVIKSLGAVPHQVDGVSGATILGDGSVALILDVPKLIAETASDRRETAGEAV